MKRIFVFVLFIGSVQLSKAQFAEYYVKRMFGEASIVRPNAKKEKLKSSSFIFKDDVITIHKKGVVITLLNHENFLVILDKPGEFKTSNLQDYKSPEPTGISKKLVKLFWHEFFQPETEKNRLSPSNLAGTWGASEKDDCNFGVLPANGASLYADTVYFAWKSITNVGGKYMLKLYNDNKHEIITVITSDTSVGLLKRHLIKENQTIIYWKVANESGTCISSGEYRLKLFIDKETAKRNIDSLISTVPQEGDVLLENIRKADALGQQGWFKESIEYLKEALLLTREQ